MRLAIIVSTIVILVSPATAQRGAPAGAPQFAAVSIGPSAMPDVFTIGDGEPIPFFREFQVGPGDRFQATTTLRRLVDYAYGFDQRWDHAKGIDPLLDQMFHVAAQGAAGSFDTAITGDDLPAVRHMLQQLLADRFKLTVTTVEETRSAMILRRASPTRFGPKLKRVTGGCVEGSQADADARGLARCVWNQQGSKFKVVVSDFDRVATWASRTGRLDVVNETGLIGAFEFETAFDPYTINRIPTPPLDVAGLDPSVARMFSAQPHYPLEPSFETAMRNDLDLAISYEPRRARVLLVTHVEPLK